MRLFISLYQQLVILYMISMGYSLITISITDPGKMRSFITINTEYSRVITPISLV